jgi:uncharacterized protein
MSDTLIQATIQFVKETLANAEGGHDWFHIERVWKISKTIAAGEKVNMLIVELAALLHDIADSKFHEGDETIGPKKAAEFLHSQQVDPIIIQEVIQIIANISFKGGHTDKLYHSAELNVVQDADRIDAIGAIGIARAFNYGGFKNRGLYDPAIPPIKNMDKETYKKSQAPTINHFYEKLLLLKDLMNTEKGKKLAIQRHHFMEQYLEQFYNEWNGKL